MRELTLTEVETLMREAVAHGQSVGRASSVAVVDMGGHVRGALRPEKGRIINVPIAEKKAWTAAAFSLRLDWLFLRMITAGRIIRSAKLFSNATSG